jgi:hypothetical protein
MTTIAQFPASSTLTGSELVGVMQSGVTSQTTSAAMAALAIPLVPQGIPLGQQSLSTKATFATSVANAPLIANYQFGTATVGGPGITTIATQAQLAQYFNPFEDFTGETTINAEFERYQPFNSVNHNFTSTSLMLQAVNPNNDWTCTAITQIAGTVNLNNTPTGIAALGLLTTSAITVGQMVMVQTSGTYYVTAIVANTSVTLQATVNSPAGTQTSGLIFWMPVYGLPLSTGYILGQATMTFASIPSQVTQGMMMGVHNAPVSGFVIQRDQDYRAQTIAGNVVTLSTPWDLDNLGVGTIIWFMPIVTSGQIWSKLQIDLTNPQSFFAIEANLTLLGNDGAASLTTAKTLAAFNALPTDVPWGGWPAFWMYSADDGNSNAETASASEIDILEVQISQSQDGHYMNTGNAGSGPTASIFTKSDSGWKFLSAFGIFEKTDGTSFVGNHLYQLIVANGCTYRFLDGVLFNTKQFYWSAQRPAQFSVGIAMGAANVAAGQNTLFPNAPTNFPSAQVAVQGIRVWYQPA